MNCYPQSLIFRLSWVHLAKHHNFVVSVIRWLKEQKSVSIVDDQWGIPTSAYEVARAIESVLDCYQQQKSFRRGIYHFASNGSYHRWKCALLIKTIMIEKGEISSNFPLIPIKTASLHLPALRPKHAVLEHHVFEQTFSFTPENWQDGVKRTVLNELGELKQSEK